MSLRRITPEIDPSHVGIGFIDVLFALVIANILGVIGWPPVGRLSPQSANLAVAMVVTLASWVGYHNSANRPRFKIRFFNLPIIQFAIDVALVLDYWLLATSAVSKSADVTSGLVASELVLSAFVLYIVWDLVGMAIGAQATYRQEYLKVNPSGYRFSPWRPITTIVCTVLALATFLLARHDGNNVSVYMIDSFLIGIALIFRVAKDHLK